MAGLDPSPRHSARGARGRGGHSRAGRAGLSPGAGAVSGRSARLDGTGAMPVSLGGRVADRDSPPVGSAGDQTRRPPAASRWRRGGSGRPGRGATGRSPHGGDRHPARRRLDQAQGVRLAPAPWWTARCRPARTAAPARSRTGRRWCCAGALTGPCRRRPPRAGQCGAGARHQPLVDIGAMFQRVVQHHDPQPASAPASGPDHPADSAFHIRPRCQAKRFTVFTPTTAIAVFVFLRLDIRRDGRSVAFRAAPAERQIVQGVLGLPVTTRTGAPVSVAIRFRKSRAGRTGGAAPVGQVARYRDQVGFQRNRRRDQRAFQARIVPAEMQVREVQDASQRGRSRTICWPRRPGGRQDDPQGTSDMVKRNGPAYAASRRSNASSGALRRCTSMVRSVARKKS